MADPSELIPRVLSNTFTKNDCYKRLLVLQDFLAHARFTPSSAASVLAEQIRAHYANGGDREAAEAVAEWGDDFLHKVNDSTGDAVGALKRYVETLPDLVLNVPTTFEPAHLRAIGEWCRAHVDPQVLLDLRVDPGAVGGCIFVWKNVLHDFSLEYFMRKHKEELAQLVARVSSGDWTVQAET